MDLKTLMTMSVAARTDYLEKVAIAQGLTTAPGVRTESEILGALLPPAPPQIHGDPRDFHTRTLFAHYFKAPLLLARLLQLFHPHLLGPRQRRLRVLYVGAARDETLDEGRWFPVVWDALGIRHQQIELTAVGPELAMRHTWEPSPLKDLVCEVPPTLTEYVGTLEDALAPAGRAPDWEVYFDIVVMHHPGFVAHAYDWLHDEAWQDLAGFAGVPIVGTSFDATDFAFDRNGLALSGRLVDRVFWNSAAHVAPGQEIENARATRLQWGGVVWSTILDPDVREDGVSPHQELATQWFARNGLAGLIGNQMSRQSTPLLGHLYWYYTCPMQFDDMLQSVHVTDDIRIEAGTGNVTAFGQVVPGTDLSLRITQTPLLEERLALMIPLLTEIRPHLNWRKVLALTLRRERMAFAAG